MQTRRQEGFSMPEILVVFSIMGAFLAMLVPSLNTMVPRIRFDASVRQIASDVAYQRLRAVERRQTTSLEYDEQTRTYTLEPYGIRRELPTEITWLSMPDIQFNPRGINPAYTTTNIMITGKGGRSKLIEVSAAGRVRITEQEVP